MNAGGRVVTVAAAPQGGDDDEAGRPAAGQCLAGRPAEFIMCVAL